MPRPRIQIDERIARALAQAQFSNAEIAKACGCSQDTLERRFAGSLQEWKGRKTAILNSPEMGGDGLSGDSSAVIPETEDFAAAHEPTKGQDAASLSSGELGGSGAPCTDYADSPQPEASIANSARATGARQDFADSNVDGENTVENTGPGDSLCGKEGVI